MPIKVVRRKDTGKLTFEGTIEFPDGSRQRIRTRAPTDDPRLAREAAVALEARILRDDWHGKRRGTRSFAEAVEAYLESEPRSASTKRRLHRLLQTIGDPPLSEIGQETVIRLRRKFGITAPATIRRGIITPLRSVINFANRLRWCDAPRFEIPREPPGRTRFLLPGEAEQLIAAASPHIRTLVILLLCTGARMAEALELDWRDVDLGAARATFWKTKGGRGRRIAHLPPAAIAALSSLPYRDGRIIRRHDGRPYADRDRQGGGQIKTAWRATLRRAELDPDLTPHDLRHTWASWHYAVNLDLLALKVEGAWSSVTLVERYAHLIPVEQVDAIRQFWRLDGAVQEVRAG